MYFLNFRFLAQRVRGRRKGKKDSSLSIKMKLVFHKLGLALPWTQSLGNSGNLSFRLQFPVGLSTEVRNLIGGCLRLNMTQCESMRVARNSRLTRKPFCRDQERSMEFNLWKICKCYFLFQGQSRAVQMTDQHHRIGYYKKN